MCPTMSKHGEFDLPPVPSSDDFQTDPEVVFRVISYHAWLLIDEFPVL